MRSRREGEGGLLGWPPGVLVALEAGQRLAEVAVALLVDQGTRRRRCGSGQGRALSVSAEYQDAGHQTGVEATQGLSIHQAGIVMAVACQV